MAKTKQKPNPQWEEFKTALYATAEKSEMGFRWLWQITNPKEMPNIRELSCAMVGNKIYLFQVWRDSGFTCYEENQIHEISGIVKHLFNGGI